MRKTTSTLTWLTGAALGALALSPAAQAAEPAYGQVLSKTAVFSQVQTPQQQCTQQQVLVQQPNTGTGAVIGAVAGGLVGSAVGKGAGSAVATGVGVIAGAIAGDQAERNANPPTATTAQSCQTVMVSEQRLSGYDVTYDYQGQRYTSRVAHDPGERIALNVTVSPVDALPVAQAAPGPTSVIYTQPPVVYQAPPPVYRPSVGVNFDWVFGPRRWH